MANSQNKNLTELYEAIVHPERELDDCFNVFCYESGTGKTLTLCNALKDLNESKPFVKTLIVTKLKEEQGVLCDLLGDLALVYNSENKQLSHVVRKATVLIITHEMYKILCEDWDRRQDFVSDRTNLIIDEQLELLDYFDFSQIKGTQVRDALDALKIAQQYIVVDGNEKILDLSELWGQTIEPLNEAMSQNYQKNGMKFVYFSNHRNKTANKNIDLILENVNNGDFVKSKKTTDGVDSIPNKKILIDIIESVKHFYSNNKVLAYSGRLFTCNGKIKHFFLENNILLDATGRISSLYKKCNYFHMRATERTVDHSNTVLTLIEENSTTSAISEKNDYYEKIGKYILTNTTKEDKVLIIGREPEREKLDGMLQFTEGKLEFVNFDAMRGRNNWKDFNVCFVIHTPNQVFHKYVLQYMYYSRVSLGDDDIETAKRGSNIGFVNNKLDDVRVTDVVSSIYQGLKRINRRNELNARWYVVLKDKRMQELLIDQFKNLKEVRRERIYESRYDNSRRIENSIAGKIRDWLKNEWDGELVKLSDMLNRIGISNKQYDNAKNKDKELISLLNQYKIKKGYYAKAR